MKAIEFTVFAQLPVELGVMIWERVEMIPEQIPHFDCGIRQTPEPVVAGRRLSLARGVSDTRASRPDRYSGPSSVPSS